MTSLLSWLGFSFANSDLLHQLLAQMDTVGNIKRN